MKNSKRKSVKSNVEKIRDVKPKKAKGKTKKDSPPFESKYHFRRYKIYENGKRHPKLIVGEVEDDNGKNLKYMSLTSKVKKGTKAKRKNIELQVNPNINAKADKNGIVPKSYLRREVKTDIEENFEKQEMKDYKLSSIDTEKIENYLKQKER